MNKMKRTIQHVLKKITPTKAEAQETRNVINTVIQATEKIIRPLGLNLVLAGSYRRDTWLPDKKEFDVFICFPEDVKRERLEKKGLDVGKKIVNALGGEYTIAYAEHPYVRAVVKGYDIDIVPCYAVKDAARIKSAVDRTPFHNRWLEKNLPKKLVPDVRLLKQFTKGQGVYGSDAKTLGLSGYLCELLIIHYGSFQNFLRGASKWRAGRVFIDLQKHHKKVKPVKERDRFKGHPIIVIDPVDPNRNVAAAFSNENFQKLVRASVDFLKKPSERFFFRSEPRIDSARLKNEMEKRKTKFLAVYFRHPDVIEDVLWPQMRKFAKRIKDILEEYEFVVMGTVVWSDDEKQCVILLELEVWELPEIRKIEGPPAYIKKRADEFTKKYRPLGKVWIENKTWYAEVKRKFRQADKKLRDSLSDKLSELKAKGIPSYIAKSISKGFNILDEKGILSLAKKDKDFGEALQKYLEKK